jgi:hypothetical protein
MSIGSFLATAGRVGQGIRAEEAAMRQTRQQQLALEELNRQDEFRRQQLTAPVSELPPQGLMLGAPMQVAQPEFTPAGQSAVAGLLAPSAGGVAPPAGVAPAPAAPAPVKAPRKIQIAGVTIQPWDMKRPERIHSGVAGFERIDPNASDNQQAAIRSRNEVKLGLALNNLIGNTDVWFGSLRKGFVSQDQKRTLEASDAAAQWYRSNDAKDYFRRNPEMLAVAQKNPVNFFDGLNRANQFTQAAAPAPRAAAPAAVAAPAAAGPLADIITQIRQVETGGLANPYVSNLAGASSAFGPYQFTRSTWIGTYRKLNPNTGLSDDKIWAQRTNPELNERLMARLTQDNANSLTKAGIPVNAPTAYLAHFLGSSGAIKLLQSDANTPVENLLSKQVIDANPTVLKGKTVGQVAQWAAGRTAGGAGTGTQMASAGVNTGATPAATPTRIDPSSFYLADQNMISQDMRVAIQNRQELARMAQMYRNAGMGDQFTQARLKMMDLDNSLLFLQGMQGIQDIALANDPRRIAAVWSQYAGVPIQLQPQTDGTYNISVNGRITQRGVASNIIIDSARSAFDAEYRKTSTESSNSMAIEKFKSQLRISEESAKAVLQTAREAQNKLIEGDNARAVEMIKQMDPNGKITMLPDGSGRSILQVQGQTIMLDPGGNPIEGAPEGMVSGPSGRSIAGLPARTVGVGVGG